MKIKTLTLLLSITICLLSCSEDDSNEPDSNSQNGTNQSNSSQSSNEYRCDKGSPNIIGAKCNDGSRSDATGQGACSRHDGVDYWICR